MPDQAIEPAVKSAVKSTVKSSIEPATGPAVESVIESATGPAARSALGPDRRREPVKFIVNPVSAHGRTRKEWPRIAAILERLGVPFEACFTRGPGDAVVQAQQAARDGYWLVVGVGGDGTANEIVNGLMAYRAERDAARDTGAAKGASGGETATATGAVETAMGIIPVGTGNDLARSLYIPMTYEDACRRIAEGQTVFMDLGRMTYHAGGQERSSYFINVASTGFSSEVANRTNLMPKLMRGTLTYMISVFVTLVAFRNQRVEVKIDEQIYRRRLNSLVVGNGNYFGGGMFVAPDAQADDGLFDCVLLGDFSRPELIVNFPKLYKGTHLAHPKVEVFRGKRVEVASVEKTVLQADGEILGEGPVVFEMIPRALEVVV